MRSAKRRYRILVINWQDIRHPLAGGAEVHLHEIFRRVALEHDVTLLCCSFADGADEEEIDGIRVVRRGGRNFFNYVVPKAYRELARNRRYDIVLDDLNKIPFFTPLFVKEPILAIAHHFFGSSIFKEVSPWYGTYVCTAEYLVRWVYRRTPFAVVSESTRRELRRWGIKSEIHILPNAVEFEAYTGTDEPTDEPVIGYLGRLKKYKSIDHLIRALPLIRLRVPNARLKIIGGGDAEAMLRGLCRELELEEWIEFTGHVSQIDKVKHLRSCAVVVNPSPKEGWGLTVLEANACGIPVVAADSPGLRDSVVDGVTGLLYEYGNLQALAERVTELLLNKDKRLALGSQATAWAKQWSWDESARIAVELIERYAQHKS